MQRSESFLDVDEAAPGAPETDTWLRLWTVDRDEFGVFSARSLCAPKGEPLRGPVAMTGVSEALVIASRVDDHWIQISGLAGDHLHVIGAVGEHVDDLVAIVDLVHHLGRWHLFGLDARGRTTHHVSDDLASWRRQIHLEAAFPAFSVSGACAVREGLVLAGRVVGERETYGWGLLSGDGDQFVARPVPIPLSAQLEVIGPVATGGSGLALLLNSGTAHTVARSTGTSWTLSLLTPSIDPASAFAVAGDVWMAGHRGGVDRPFVARVGDAEAHRLDGPRLGAVRRAVAVGGQLVLACDERID